jgi:hypothetical protein
MVDAEEAEARTRAAPEADQAGAQTQAAHGVVPTRSAAEAREQRDFGRAPARPQRERSTPQPEAGLSDGRLALLDRYMADVEEAEARTRAAAEADQARAQAQARVEMPTRSAAEAREQHEFGRAPVRPQRVRRIEPGPGRDAGEEAPQPTRHTVNGVAGVAVDYIPELLRRPSAKEEARARRAAAKEDRRTAKQAARMIAALEKREARERRALAKAAARRKPKEISGI